MTGSAVVNSALFRQRTAELDVDASCDADTGSLPLTLADSKPGGPLLELGTGIGFGSMHLLAGMDAASRLDTAEPSETFSTAAQSLLHDAGRARFIAQDRSDWIRDHKGKLSGFMFADTWPGRFPELDETLALLASGGIYFINDLFPQPNRPLGHQGKADALRLAPGSSPLFCTSLAWTAGLMTCVRTGEDS